MRDRLRRQLSLARDPLAAVLRHRPFLQALRRGYADGAAPLRGPGRAVDPFALRPGDRTLPRPGAGAASHRLPDVVRSFPPPRPPGSLLRDCGAGDYLGDLLLLRPGS